MFTTFQTADCRTVQARTPERAAAISGTTDLRAMPPGRALVDERWWSVRKSWGLIQFRAYRAEGADWTIWQQTGDTASELLRPGSLGYRDALASMPEGRT